MLRWLQQYNTHKKDTDKVNQEFCEMYKEEQKSTKKFYENHKDLLKPAEENSLKKHESPVLG